MKTKILISILVGMLVIPFVSAVLAIPANDNAGGVERVPVFIGFTQTPGPSEQALVRSHGGAIKYSYHLVPAIAASIPEPAIQGLLRNPNVTYIEPVIEVYAVDTELDDSWGVKRIGAGTVHTGGNTGAGVKVAIIDSGIDYTHLDLDDNYAGGWDFVNNDAFPMDDYGHGTHVAGTVAAEDNDDGVVGVAPEASLYALKVLGANGDGDYDDVIAALEWATDNGIQITNNSYGSSGDPGTTVEDAFENCLAVHVCAAGNNGTPPGRGDNVIYPARYESCIAVAATDDSDSRARFSSTGPDVELSAPGVSIYSTLPGGYGTGSGTSMASPHVAGVVALMIANGGYSRGTLSATADDLGDPGWDPKYGWGLVNAAAAAGIAEPPEEPTYDVAVTSITALSTVFKGDLVAVDVTVANEGTYDESFTLTLTDETDIVSIGSAAVNLAAGASTIVNFSWDTTGASLGDHTLTASHDFADDDATNDSKSITVNVTEAGDLLPMYVASIEMDLSIRKAGPNKFTRAVATVSIIDASDNPVEGATVSGFWSDATSDIDSGVTDSSGKVTLESDAVKNAPSGTTFTFIVDDVVKSGWYWIYNDKTGSIPVP